MNIGLVERIVNAVLYEGYILYPYRPSAVKNRQRWNFGALYPEAYSREQTGADASFMQTECLVKGGENATLDVKARFLHLLSREVGEFTAPLLELPEGELPDFHVVNSLEVGDQVFQTWQEAVEREADAPGLNLNELAAEPLRMAFAFPSKEEVEPLRDPSGKVFGAIVRKQEAIEGAVEVAATRIEKALFKLTARILNLTPFEDADCRSRDDALMRSMASTHTILSVRDGEFVSMIDPPAELSEIAAGCSNTGTWPVLVGEEGARDSMLSSPIILYDYPQVAPESAGDLFDSTEIDEILTLRIMTLTDEEKRDMRQVDERARRILERTESLPPEHFMKMHGTARSIRPVEEKE